MPAIPQWDVDGHERTHTVNVVEGTVTAELLPGEIGVNSLHHQVVERWGRVSSSRPRRPTASSKGSSPPTERIVAVQWHPELLEKPDPTFLWLVREASAS